MSDMGHPIGYKNGSIWRHVVNVKIVTKQQRLSSRLASVLLFSRNRTQKTVKLRFQNSSMWSLSSSSVAIILVVGALVLERGVANGADDLTLSVDGLQCSSCGVKCSSVCGSRQFKSCCLNYVKKRSYPRIHAVFRKSDANPLNLAPPIGDVEDEGDIGPERDQEQRTVVVPTWLNERQFSQYYRQPIIMSPYPDKSRIAIADEPTAITVDQHFIIHKIPEEVQHLHNST